MVKIMSQYTGKKHCKAQHEPSGSNLETDAPKDNLGLGQTFSPTDLVATALGTCVMTTVAIFAEKESVMIDFAEATTEKIMSPPPRRIASLKTIVKFSKNIPEDFKAKIPLIAENCPVKKSLHPEVAAEIEIQFI